ncbi:unnamed protein product [Owenia fusiformis]|uniref:Uncharacterized protein n=1 Tax=Owenia fusiformis TaxID=6347 RepID=A0A8J1UZF0_OWEFU|nr:unnamed protein product [Owenia fusiformis]
MAAFGGKDLSKLKVADLKKELKERGLPLSGNKTELVERLQEHIGNPADTAPDTVKDDAILDEGVDEEELLKGDDETVTETPVVSDQPTEAKPNVEPGSPSTEEHKAVKLKATAELTDAEKQKLRAQKFGLPPTDTDKKLQRAERFGLPVKSPQSASKVSSDEKLKSRAERFGLPVTSPTTSPTSGTVPKDADIQKLKSRAERFGVTVSSSLSKLETADKILKRKERFGTVITGPNTKSNTNSADEIAIKKQKRAERFGL